MLPITCQYRQQVVAGMNYEVIVSAGDRTWMAKIYQPLPYTKQPATVTSFEQLKA